MTDETPKPARRRWTDDQRREILKKLDESGLGVREFGDQAGISWSLLYQWRRRETAGAAPDRRLPTKATESSRGRRPAKRRDERPTFAQVHVVHEASGADRLPSEDRSRIEIAHRSGWSVFVEGGFDARELTRVLAAVDDRC